jgi:hypothetical protein
VAFRLGSRTAFEFLNLDDRSMQVRLSEGMLNISVRRLEGDLEVDTPTLALTIRSPGEYRIDTNPDTLQDYVTVRSGESGVTTNAGSFPLHTRQTAVVSGQDYRIYAAVAPDDFDRWAQSRDYREQRLQSARYVSPDVVGYEDLDEYGYWESVPDYGSVWFPRTVALGWAPYHFGHWVWIEPWGWTWVDDEPWGFAPFHYGRWAFFHERWCWVPGPVSVRPVYAPALVAWFGFGGGTRFSLGFGGDVGWFPLGPRDVYIPAYRASPTYVTRINTTNTTVINNVQITNAYNSYVKTGSVPITTYSNRTVPGAAMAVPQNALTGARPVQQAAVRVQPNQVGAIQSVAAAPRVAPQRASVLGPTAGQGFSVPKPPSAVISRPVVAKTAPPPPPAPLQQRLPLLAKDPGKPIPIQQEKQLAQSGPAAPARPPVKVVTQARSVSPPVVNTPPPRPLPRGAVTQQPVAPQPSMQHPSTTQPAQPTRPFEPPAAQSRQAPQTNPARPTPPPQAPPKRSVEPPVSRPQPTPQPQANRPAAAPREQPRAQQPTNRPVEPPAAQPRPAHQTNPARPSPPPPALPNRSVEPPVSRPQPTPQPQANRPAAPPREQPRVPALPSPQGSPPPAAHPAPRTTPPPQPREEPAKPRPPDQKKEEKGKQID